MGSEQSSTLDRRQVCIFLKRHHTVSFQQSKEQRQLNHVGQGHQEGNSTVARRFSFRNFYRGGKAPAPTPQLRQSAITECGLTALAIIFHWHGIDVSLDRLRHEIGSSRLGLTARQLLALARRYDFDTKAYRREIDQLATLPRPFIAHSRFIHFVVVEDVSDRHVTINDPDSGPQRVTLEDFARDFTGIALTFIPCSPENRRPVHPARREFWLQLRDDRLSAAIFCVLSLLQTSAVATGLAMMAPSLNNGDHLGPALLPWLMAAILHGLLHWSTDSWADRLALRTQDLALRRFESMPPHWFAEKDPSQLADMLNLAQRWLILLPDILSFARSLLFIPVLLVAPWISLSSGVLVASLAAIASWIAAAACFRRGEIRMRRMRPDGLFALPDALILADLESRQFGGRDAELAAHLAGEHARMHSQAQVNHDWQAKLDVVMALPLITALTVSIAAGLIDGNWGIAAALGTLCLVVGFCLLTARQNFSAMKDLMGLLSRLHDLRNTDTDHTVSEPSQEPVKGLVIHLSGTHLVLNRGELLWIVGPSGSGKTRLARQIAGLEPCPQGAITFAGQSTEVLCHLGSPEVMLVDQQVFTIPASVADNLCLGEDRFNRSMLEHVLDVVELTEELDQRGGLDLVLSSDRRLLSGGQLRRLSLARVLLREPSVIVLDGALDALDAPLAGRILERLRQHYVVVLVGERGTERRLADAIIDLGA